MSETIIVRPISDKADSCLRQFNQIIHVLEDPLFQCPAPKPSIASTLYRLQWRLQAIHGISHDLIVELSPERVAKLQDRFHDWWTESGARWGPGFVDGFPRWDLYPRPLDLPSNDVEVNLLAVILENLEKHEEELMGVLRVALGKEKNYVTSDNFLKEEIDDDGPITLGQNDMFEQLTTTKMIAHFKRANRAVHDLERFGPILKEQNRNRRRDEGNRRRQISMTE